MEKAKGEGHEEKAEGRRQIEEKGHCPVAGRSGSSDGCADGNLRQARAKERRARICLRQGYGKTGLRALPTVADPWSFLRILEVFCRVFLGNFWGFWGA
jgi:hypothetical protein